MRNRLFIAVLALAALMVPFIARAEVTVLRDTPIIQEVGRCCNPNGDQADPLTCNAGEQPKCGWLGGTSEGNKYNPPVAITTFQDAQSAHEEVGTITVECDSGQAIGDNDSGDYDIPTEVFDDGAGGVVTPDASGRWGSGSCLGTCFLDPIQLGNYLMRDGIIGFWWYNYGFDANSGSATPLTAINRLECFRTNPALPATNAAGVVYTAPATGCDAVVGADDWVVGTLVDFQIPFGVRLSNTLYPGINLEGKNQFDQRSSGEFDPGNNGWIYPAVVFRWEANHRLAGYGPNNNEPLPSPSFDRVKIFVPDILDALATNPTNPSSFVLGEDLFDTPQRIPAGRTLVQQCTFAQSVEPCNYDTTICIDIRGADPVYRARDPITRFVKFVIEDPLGTTYTPSVFEIAILRERTTSGTMTATSLPEALPNCDGYVDCYWTLDETTGGLSELLPGATDPGLLYVSFEEAVGPVSFTEPQGNYIQVDSGAGTLNQYSTITCTLLDPTNVAFVEFDEQPNSFTTCPLRCDLDWVNNPLLMPLGVSCDAINTPLGVTVGFTPTGTGMTGEILRITDDSIIARIITESGPNSPATITISGYNLLINDRALPGGIGCIEVECVLSFPVAECPNHVGVANTDTADSGNPNQNNAGAAPGDHRPNAAGGGESFTLPITCIVPGRTVLLYPYLVKAVGFDSGLVVTNTAGSEAIVHFYLYEEGGRTNIDTNPDLSVLQAADPKRLVKGVDPLYDEYIEIPRYGQYVNLIFEFPGDPNSGVPKHECGSPGSSGIFADSTLQDLCTDLGRVWVYAVIEQCYSHGYQMIFSEGGFGSTLALVDQDTDLLPFSDDHVSAPRDGAGVTSGTRFLPVHTPPSRFHDIGTAGLVDQEVRVYRFWNGNDQ